MLDSLLDLSDIPYSWQYNVWLDFLILFRHNGRHTLVLPDGYQWHTFRSLFPHMSIDKKQLPTLTLPVKPSWLTGGASAPSAVLKFLTSHHQWITHFNQEDINFIPSPLLSERQLLWIQFIECNSLSLAIWCGWYYIVDIWHTLLAQEDSSVHESEWSFISLSDELDLNI